MKAKLRMVKAKLRVMKEFEGDKGEIEGTIIFEKTTMSTKTKTTTT